MLCVSQVVRYTWPSVMSKCENVNKWKATRLKVHYFHLSYSTLYNKSEQVEFGCGMGCRGGVTSV